jgi:hypothetical protein
LCSTSMIYPYVLCSISMTYPYVLCSTSMIYPYALCSTSMTYPYALCSTSYDIPYACYTNLRIPVEHIQRFQVQHCMLHVSAALHHLQPLQYVIQNLSAYTVTALRSFCDIINFAIVIKLDYYAYLFLKYHFVPLSKLCPVVYINFEN